MPMIFAAAALKKTRNAAKSYKEKDYENAEKNCQQQFILLDKVDLDAFKAKSPAKLKSDLLLIRASCLEILGKIAGVRKDWRQAITFHAESLQHINEGSALTPERITWDELRGNAYWSLAGAYQHNKDFDKVREFVLLTQEISKKLITLSKQPFKWRAINLIANWELKRENFQQHLTRDFVEDVANYQLMVDEIEKEAKAYREQASGNEKGLKYADVLDQIVRKFQSRLKKIYNKDNFDLRIAS